MKQILSTRHLIGQSVSLGTDGRSVSLDDPGGDIDLGSITDGGLHPSSLLVDVLPELPDEPVSKDLTWDVEMNVHFREVVLGTGSLDYKTYLRRLAELPGDPPLMIEHLSGAEEYATSREHLFTVGRECGVAFE